jgi:hypothetical protein
MGFQTNLLKAASAVLDSNWTGSFTKPAPNLYPHQWNWDAGFIALGNAHINPDRAQAEMRKLFDAQWSNGMLPQIVFGEEKNAQYFPGPDFWQTAEASAAPKHVQTSGITMPPVHGFILWEIYQNTPNKLQGLQFLEEMFPKVEALHRYLYTYRDPEEEGLVSIRHPWEGGTDNSPIWDHALSRINPTKEELPPYVRKDLQNPKAAAHRPTDQDYDRYVYLVDLFRQRKYDEAAITRDCPFQIQDPLFNAILIWSNECLIEMGFLLGKDMMEWIELNELSIHSMNEKLWDEERGIYNAYDVYNDELIPVHTSSGLMPLIGCIPTQEQAEQILLTLEGPMFGGNQKDFFACPTYSLEAPDINYQKYWRGPVWINLNWLLYKGLLRYDMEEMAEKVKQETLELIGEYGFYEYFDPRRQPVGNLGCGTNQFSWTAALCIDLLKS